MALGLEREQLEDAEIIDAGGVELGEVERLISAGSGTVTALMVEIDDTSPDRYVTLPVEGLQVVQNGDDRDLRTTLSREQLLQLPSATRR